MLRILYRRRLRNLPKSKGPGPGPEHGPQGRIDRMREMVTSLIRQERIEGITEYVDESRGYAERVWDTLVTSLCSLYCVGSHSVPVTFGTTG